MKVDVYIQTIVFKASATKRKSDHIFMYIYQGTGDYTI